MLADHWYLFAAGAAVLLGAPSPLQWLQKKATDAADNVVDGLKSPTEDSRLQDFAALLRLRDRACHVGESRYISAVRELSEMVGTDSAPDNNPELTTVIKLDVAKVVDDE